MVHHVQRDDALAPLSATRHEQPEHNSRSSSCSSEMEQVLQLSPYWATALALDGRRCYQSPKSLEYFGDVAAEAAIGGEEVRAQLAMLVLRRLFQCESEQVLEEMLSAVLDAEGGPGAAEHSWSRVMKVPRHCRNTFAPSTPVKQSTGLEPKLASKLSSVTEACQPTHSSAFAAQHARRSNSQGRPSSGLGANTDTAERAGVHGHKLPFKQRSKMHLFSEVSSGTLADGEAPLPLPPLPSPGRQLWSRQQSGSQLARGLFQEEDMQTSTSSLAQASGNMLSSIEAAAAVSVSARHVPAKVKSMLELSIATASKSNSRDLFNRNSLTAASYVGHEHGGCPATPAAITPSPSCNLPSLAGHLPSRLAHDSSFRRSGSRSEYQVSAPLGNFSASGTGKDVPGPQRTVSRGRLLTILSSRGRDSAGVASQGQSGALAELLMAGGNASSVFSDPAMVVGVGNTSTGDVADDVAEAAVPPNEAQRSPAWRRSSAGAPFVIPEEGGEVLEHHEQEDVGETYHEVHVTRTKNRMGSELILIYQSDVTMRTQLETSMAQLTELQLNTLCQIFPRHVIEFLSTGGDMTQPANLGNLARSHQEVSILFCDIAGFTSMSERIGPDAVMTFLNSLFSIFDERCEIYGCFKVETAGDCYIASSGLLETDEEGFTQVSMDHDPVQSTARLFALAKDMLVASREVLMPHTQEPVVIRVGVHTGPCVSGVIGSKLPKFGIFGDTMNTASRMESTCTPGRMQVSGATHQMLMCSGESCPDEWEPTGWVMVKGKGMMDTYLWREPAVIIHAGSQVQGSQQSSTGAQASGSGPTQCTTTNIQLLDLLDDLTHPARPGTAAEALHMRPPPVPRTATCSSARQSVDRSSQAAQHESSNAVGRFSQRQLQPQSLMESSDDHACSQSLPCAINARALTATTSSRQLRVFRSQGPTQPSSPFHALNQMVFALARESQSSHGRTTPRAGDTGSSGLGTAATLLDTMRSSVAGRTQPGMLQRLHSARATRG